MKLHIAQYSNCSNYVSFSPWDWDQIGIKLGTKQFFVYLKLASFTSNKDVYVNMFGNVFFEMHMHILQNRTYCKMEIPLN